MLHHRTTDIALRAHHVAVSKAEKTYKENGDAAEFFSVYEKTFSGTILEFQSFGLSVPDKK